MKWWKERKALKQARELVKGTRKHLRMHRDILDSRIIQDITAAADALHAAVSAKNAGALTGLVDKLERQLEKAFPAQKHAVWRENVEVLLVAAIVAMGVRTFFFQPFKIPTGSMQPTLFGIVPATAECNAQTPLPMRIYNGAVLGTWPQHQNASMLVSLSDFVSWAIFSQWPAQGVCLFSGDHIFVDRLTYHFRKPQRGDVVVFGTGFMHDRGFDPRGAFYIKRAVALAGDHVEIKPPHLLINGKVLDDRPAFQRIYSMTNGYHGYTLPESYMFPSAKYFSTRQTSYDVPANGLLAFGDNTTSSLDSRFWGEVPADAVVGRALLVYWPFTKRFGLIN